MDTTLQRLKFVLTILWPVIAGIVTLLTAYKGFLYESINQTNLIQANEQRINHLYISRTEVKTNYSNLIGEINMIHIKLVKLDDQNDNLAQDLQKATDYQETLRKEVQNLAETKLNISEFWRYVTLQKKGG